MCYSLVLVLLGLIGLLAGISLMPRGLEALGQSKIKKAVANFTATPTLAALTGMIITMLVQSSSAVTVLSIGLVNRGLMTLSQGLGIILGTNIGTTITAQLIAFNLTSSGPYLLAAGIAIRLFPFRRTKALSQIICGLGLIFLGLNFLELAFRPLGNSPRLLAWFHILGDHYFLALLTGTVVTALLQSSTAVIGLTLVLGQQNLLSLSSAIAIMLGSNLGTCATALLAAATASIDAKRIALAHVLLNAIGILAFFPFIQIFARLLTFMSQDLPRQIASGHTIFNILCSLLILPFIHQFAAFICWLLPHR